jgi:hypothetical protein
VCGCQLSPAVQQAACISGRRLAVTLAAITTQNMASLQKPGDELERHDLDVLVIIVTQTIVVLRAAALVITKSCIDIQLHAFQASASG